MIVLAVAATYRVWAEIALIAYRDSQQSHIFLVPIVVAWLVWVRHERFAQCRRKGTLLGPLVVIAGWLMMLGGPHYQIEAAVHLGAVLVVTGCLLAVLGWEVLQKYLPAFIALAFLVPVPGIIRQKMGLPIQIFTANGTYAMFDLLGIPVERAGYVLSINGVQVSIVRAINGMKMVCALGIVSYAFAFGTPLRGYVRALILLLFPVSAVACNVGRMVPTVWLYGYGPKPLANLVAATSGWVMVLLAFGLLLGIIRLLRWATIPISNYTLAYD